MECNESNVVYCNAVFKVFNTKLLEECGAATPAQEYSSSYTYLEVEINFPGTTHSNDRE